MVVDETAECAKRLVGAEELVFRPRLHRHHDEEVSVICAVPIGQAVATGRVFR